MTHALDACAMIAYLRNEPGGAAVDALLASDTEACVAHAVNLIEVRYDFLRAAGPARADAAIAALAGAGLIVRRDLGDRFRRDVAALKAAHRISLADCFCLTLARQLTAEVVTTDHREFDALVPLNLAPIRFVR